MKSKSATLITKRSGNLFIKVTFPFDYDSVSKIKSFTGYSFSSLKKCWYVPVSLKNARELERWGCLFSTELKIWCKEEVARRNEASAITSIPGLKGNPYQYQWEGISFIEKQGGRALVADEMGLGKTLQALAWLQLHPELRPAIISVPASLKLNWAREANHWMTKPNVQILFGQSVKELTGDIIILNHDILEWWTIEIKKIQPAVIVIDEIHYFKNPKTMRSKALQFLAKGIKHVIGLSGTPILNRPIELYFISNLISKNSLPNYDRFTKRYCAARNNGFGMDVSGASNTDELYDILINSFMIRRKKADVLTELPPKTYSYVPLEISNRKEYTKAENDFILYSLEKISAQLDGINLEAKKVAKTAFKANDFTQLDLFSDMIAESQKIAIQLDKIEKIKSAEELIKIGALRQLAAQGKMQEAINWIKDFLESCEKLVIFATHTKIINQIVAAFPKIIVKVDGSVTGIKRQEAVDAFQTDKKIRLFIGNKAAEEGITLTAASNLCHLELPWNPGSVDQRNDRCHRIGQKNAVNIFYLLATNTIDEKMATLVDTKRVILSSTLDGEKAQSIQLLKELIKLYKK